jgi:hypothetical protein
MVPALDVWAKAACQALIDAEAGSNGGSP